MLDADAIIATLDERAEYVRVTPRLTRSALMGILRDCYSAGLSLCVDEVRTRLMERIASVRRNEGANRSFVLKSKETPFTVIVRHVFPETSERTNVSRYIGALDYLRRNNVSPDDFVERLAGFGGINDAYWLGRGNPDRVTSRNTLHLTTNIKTRVGTDLSITLRPRANGTFDVLHVAADKPRLGGIAAQYQEMKE